jgi:acyl-coenzyme A synthetase/AMP-(fatty) acid ligase
MYRVGDFGSVKNGVLYYEGRHDSQIKIRGHRVDTSEVERSINLLNYVEKSVILVYHSGHVDQALVAFILLKNRDEKTSIQVENDLKTKLAEYMMPQVILVEHFSYLVNGKVDRQKLLKLYEEIAAKNVENTEIQLDLENVPKDKLSIDQKTLAIMFQIIGQTLRT